MVKLRWLGPAFAPKFWSRLNQSPGRLIYFKIQKYIHWYKIYITHNYMDLRTWIIEALTLAWFWNEVREVLANDSHFHFPRPYSELWLLDWGYSRQQQPTWRIASADFPVTYSKFPADYNQMLNSSNYQLLCWIWKLIVLYFKHDQVSVNCCFCGTICNIFAQKWNK